jgi:membrane protein CcdC involved in cytochrome C biogenesis
MKLTDRLLQLDPAWRFALTAYLIARVALSGWAMLIALLFPTLTQNLELFGAPVLASFNLHTSERFAYARQVNGQTLTFRGGDAGQVIDIQTGSVWSLHDGQAISGTFAGQSLQASLYPVEDIFPYRGAAPSSINALAVWQRFDTNWYLKIAQRGYSADDGSAVYFPLYPMLIRVVGLMVRDDLLAAIIVANLALIGALVLLYRLSVDVSDEPATRRTIVYLLLFPAGFFLFAAYTESLFLFCTLGAFFFARQNRWYVATLLAVLAALTRLQGVLLIVPLAWLWWQRRGVQKSPFTFYVLFLIPLATLIFLSFTNLSLINSYTGELHARFVLPWENLGTAVAWVFAGKASFIDVTNLVITLGFGAMLIVVWQTLPREYALYAGLMFLTPLFRMTTMQPLVSMIRYVVVLFPVFIVWGRWGRNPWVNRAMVYLSFPMQLFFSAQFVLWGWVG